ncbi:MAG: hypothetical protein N2559_00305 [Anaerolineae bacterium]|nr:hypothetical protein [Anaerolineae bacterium]
MSTRTVELKQIQNRIQKMENAISQMQRALREQGLLPTRTRTTSRRKLSNHEHVQKILRQAGMLAELTPEEKARAARWSALPAEEQRRIWDEFFNLKLDKPLSDVIVENRR